MAALILPELPQTLRIEAVPQAGCEITVEADAASRVALAQRMQIPAVESLSCRFLLRRGPAWARSRKVAAEGRLQARVVLTCVITLEPFESLIDEAFEVLFVPAERLGAPLAAADGGPSDWADPDSVDEIPYEDGVLLIGEAAAEQLALALPAFPRAPGAELDLAPGGHDPVEDDNDVNPFAVLAARRKPV